MSCVDVPRLRRDGHVVVHVLVPPMPRWSNPLGTRRAEHISFRIAVIVTAVEHCDSRGSCSYAAASNQRVRAVARWIGHSNDASETAIALAE